MSGVALVYALFGGADEAERVSRAVVEEGLAACANMLAPCTSFYRWRGVLERGVEVPVLFKTTAAGRAALMARIAALHGYDVPAILSWDVADAHPPFADWVGSTVS